jgi:hypothetical protein
LIRPSVATLIACTSRRRRSADGISVEPVGWTSARGLRASNLYPRQSAGRATEPTLVSVVPSGSVTCGNCGAVRLDELAPPPAAGAPPCPACGDNSITLRVKSEETLVVAQDGSLGLGIEHAREWQHVWRGIEDASILGTQEGKITAAAVTDARSKLEHVFNECLNLRDHLDIDPTVPITKKRIDVAIDADPMLALAVDIANTTKHAVLKRRLRSGHQPRIVAVSGAVAGDGWLLRMEIEHGSNTLDGVTVATGAVADWQSLLSSWGLLASATAPPFAAHLALDPKAKNPT